jgi:hypothetical protein
MCVLLLATLPALTQ